MDFISNLIKRPISLVLNETSTTIDKYPISASLPNTTSELENKNGLATPTHEPQKLINLNHNNTKRSLSLSSSYNGDNMSDNIDVPQDFLDEFKDILPPPPLPLGNINHFTQSLFDMDNTESLAMTPPSPPLSLHLDKEHSPTNSMNASQTIDELLLQISVNLQKAGLNDDVLSIGSPSNKSELSPLSSKTSLNNSKLLNSTSASNIQLNTSKTAAGSASSTVFETNSSQHKLHIDPELQSGKQLQQEYVQNQQDAAKSKLNNSGVNKSSNKFVGLTEFDEAKIPELPGDLNPNIEEQYSVTFEECFIPTLNAQQATTISDGLEVDKTHLLLLTDTDGISSDNETFVDCSDEKDPLTSTFAEPASLDVTTEFESYQSAVNKSINSTMDNIADITMETEKYPFKNSNQIQLVEQSQTEHKDSQFEPMVEDEPMDIDMNCTMQIIHNTSNNIHVEKVLQHAENILQDLDGNTENISCRFMEKQIQSSQIGCTVNIPFESAANKTQHLDIEQSKHELSLNKCIELPVDNSKTLSSVCIIENLNTDVAQKENNELEQIKNESDHNLSLTNHSVISSTVSNSSSKSAVDSQSATKLNSTSSLSSSINSQKSSASSGTSFPIKTAESAGFPHSPKALTEKPIKSPFLEKSDYMANMETQSVENRSHNNSSESFVESSSNSVTNNLNGTYLETALSSDENRKCDSFGIDNSMVKCTEEQEPNNIEFINKRRTFSIDSLNDDKTAEEKRRTFSVKSNENTSTALMQFPSMDTEDKRRTFFVTDAENMQHETHLADIKSDLNLRRTVNLCSEELIPMPTEETGLNTSFEPMELDDTISQNTTLPLSADLEQISQSEALPEYQSPPLPAMQQTLESLPLPDNQPKSQSPPISTMPSLQVMQKSLQSPTIQPESESPPLSTMQLRSQSPPLPTMHTKSQSPTLPVTQLKAHSPRLSKNQPKSQSPPLRNMQPTSQSPPLPTMQSRSQSNHHPTIHARNQFSTPLPIMTQKQSEIQQTPQSLPDSNSQQAVNIIEEQISPPPFALQPLSTLIQKRPSIRDVRDRTADILSAKEQSNIKVKDEKDIFVEKLTPSPVKDVFTSVSATSTTLTNSSGFPEFDQTSTSSSSMMNTTGQQPKSEQLEDEFSGNNNLILNPSDFDYLLTKGNNNTPVDRSSLLLKFDPLLGVPVPVNQGQQQLQQLQIPTNTNNPCLSPTLEEDEHNDSNRSFVIGTKPGASAKLLKEVKQQLELEDQFQQNKQQITQGKNKKNATMSVDVIKDMSLDNDCNKAFENSNSTQSDDKQINYKMDELEKKIKNEVLKTEDIEKKLKDAEQREEALIKRITEKDKTIAKMTGVIEAYEKAIAELIADKEQLTQHYEKQLAEVKADRDSNYHHLTSLETTFSDLHVKYEKSKEMTCQLKESEEALQAEKRKNLENLHLQEQRYDKMKNHAMQQLEIANKKLESLTREHSIEITKLKALLKKEEIARSSINEQLAHKTKENAELVKICDELISGQGSNFSFEPFDPKKH